MMAYFGEKDAVVNIQNEQLQIQAMYGLDISFSDIENIAIIEESMSQIEPEMHRDNGYGGFGTTQKGHFSSEKLGKVLLFVSSDSSPTIWIECKENEDIYISFSDKEKTETLYDRMKEAIFIMG